MGSDSSDEGRSMWSRPFTFGNIKVRVEEEWGLGIGGTVWEGGVLLAQYLRKYRGSRCIEIGAGITGLPSIAAAHLNTFSQIVVTDIEECFEALVDNLGSNLPPTCQLRTLSDYGASLHQDPETCKGHAEGWDIPQSVIDTLAAELQNRSLNAIKRDAASPDSRHSSSSSPGPGNCAEGSRESPGGKSGGDPLQDRPTSATNGYGGSCGQGREAGKDAAGCLGLKDLESPRGGERTDVVVHVLDWKDSVEQLWPPYGVLLVADVVYIAELMEPLLECMHSLADSETLVLLAYYERSATAGAAFWSLLPSYFTQAKIPEASYGGPPHAEGLGLFHLRKLQR